MEQQTKAVQAIYRRDLRAVQASVNQLGKRDLEQRTALMHAAMIDFAEAVDFILKSRFSAQEVRQRDKDGNTALLLAVQRGCRRSVHLLAAAEGGATNIEGQFALLLATLRNDAAMVGELAERENGMQFKGRTPLIIAIQCNCMDVIPTLIMYESRVFCAARSRSDSLIGYSTSVRPSFDTQQAESAPDEIPRMSSSLMVAALSGNMLAVKYLVEFERGLQDPRSGETALIRVLDKIAELSTAQGEQNHSMVGKLLAIAQTLAQVDEEVTTCDMRGRYPADIVRQGSEEMQGLSVAVDPSFRRRAARRGESQA